MAWDGYKSKRWRRLRRCILRRDGYRCREWARYGKAVEATTVHHVWPAEEYPEYAWAPWNLVSLSGDRHDAMVMYEKLAPNLRIDVFDCAVFAACTYLEDLDGRSRGSGWFEEETKEGDPQ